MPIPISESFFLSLYWPARIFEFWNSNLNSKRRIR